MQHLDFVLWLVLFPPAQALSTYLTILSKKAVYEEWIWNTGTLIGFTVWAAVGVLLWQAT